MSFVSLNTTDTKCSLHIMQTQRKHHVVMAHRIPAETDGHAMATSLCHTTLASIVGYMLVVSHRQSVYTRLLSVQSPLTSVVPVYVVTSWRESESERERERDYSVRLEASRGVQ